MDLQINNIENFCSLFPEATNQTILKTHAENAFFSFLSIPRFVFSSNLFICERKLRTAAVATNQKPMCWVNVEHVSSFAFSCMMCAISKKKKCVRQTLPLTSRILRGFLFFD